METERQREELRSVSVGDGGPSMVMDGLRLSLLLSAMTLDMRLLVDY